MELKLLDYGLMLELFNNGRYDYFLKLSTTGFRKHMLKKQDRRSVENLVSFLTNHGISCYIGGEVISTFHSHGDFSYKNIEIFGIGKVSAEKSYGRNEDPLDLFFSAYGYLSGHIQNPNKIINIGKVIYTPNKKILRGTKFKVSSSQKEKMFEKENLDYEDKPIINFRLTPKSNLYQRLTRSNKTPIELIAIREILFKKILNRQNQEEIKKIEQYLYNDIR
ncbi:MAG: hypothetical protein QXW97_02885 [Candidatus Pacearchaeota archaeon]